jgi:hypothetical protein
MPVLAWGQGTPPVPKAGPQHYVPVTVVLNLEGLKILDFLPAVPPPPLPGFKPKGGLLQKIRDKKPLQKLFALLAERKDLVKELDKLAQPVNVGDDLWLNLNLREVVFTGVDIDLGKKAATVHLAAQLAPVLVLTKDRPAPPALPQLTLNKDLPPPPPGGTPIDIVLKIDPPALPNILPPETKDELAKYGIDSADITFAQKSTGAAQKLIVSVPMQKPLPATLTVWFTPKVKENILTFIEPDCTVTVLKNKDKPDDSVQKTLTKLTQEAIRSLVTGRLKSAEVDFTPHIKKMANLPLGQPAEGGPAKIHAPISNLRVENLGAENNHLVLHISGLVAKGGIVISP